MIRHRNRLPSGHLTAFYQILRPQSSAILLLHLSDNRAVARKAPDLPGTAALASRTSAIAPTRLQTATNVECRAWGMAMSAHPRRPLFAHRSPRTNLGTHVYLPSMAPFSVASVASTRRAMFIRADRALAATRLTSLDSHVLSSVYLPSLAPSLRPRTRHARDTRVSSNLASLARSAWAPSPHAFRTHALRHKEARAPYLFDAVPTAVRSLATGSAIAEGGAWRQADSFSSSRRHG
ncbi:hypothetical protein ERJ75_001267000 [Trypanosoma vivax]|nr:hypothetical protein ERJ75_001267000 [Trypanosoma vivax]